MVGESWWQRMRHATTRPFRLRYRQATACELDLLAERERLRSEIDRLNAVISDRDQVATNLRTELSEKDSTIKIQGGEIEKLMLVCQRDRVRIEAELASEAARIAVAAPGPRRQE
jgi:hypothetical protein